MTSRISIVHWQIWYQTTPKKWRKKKHVFCIHIGIQKGVVTNHDDSAADFRNPSHIKSWKPIFCVFDICRYVILIFEAKREKEPHPQMHLQMPAKCGKHQGYWQKPFSPLLRKTSQHNFILVSHFVKNWVVLWKTCWQNITPLFSKLRWLAKFLHWQPKKNWQI